MPRPKKKEFSSLELERIRGQFGRSEMPHLSEIAEHFIQMAGGIHKVAELLFEEFKNAKKGSLTRTRILDLFMRSLQSAAKDDLPDNLGLLTKDDLDAAIDGRLRKMAQVLDDDDEQPEVPASE